MKKKIETVKCCNPGCQKKFELTDSTKVLVKTQALVALCPTCSDTQARVEAQIAKAIGDEERSKKPNEQKLKALRKRQRELVQLQTYGTRERFYMYYAKWSKLGPQDGKTAQEFFSFLYEMEATDSIGKITLKWGGRYFLLSGGLEKAAFSAVKKGHHQFQPAKVTLAELAKTCDVMVAGFTLEDLKNPSGKARHLSGQAKKSMVQELKDRTAGKRRPRRKPEPKKPEIVVQPKPQAPPHLPEAKPEGGNGKDEEALKHAPFAALAAKDKSAPIAPDGILVN